MARIINNHEFQNEVLESKEVVLIDFYADWCGPCKMLAPAVEEISREVAGKAKVFKINVDNESDIARRYGIMSIPTVMIFQNGKPVDKMVGFQPKDTLKNKLEKYLD